MDLSQKLQDDLQKKKAALLQIEKEFEEELNALIQEKQALSAVKK